MNWKRHGLAVRVIFSALLLQIACVSNLTLANENDSEGYGYIFLHSDIRRLTDRDLEGRTLQEINYGKNEIYARHGRKFLSRELTEFFNTRSWYQPTIAPENFSESVFNDVERYNAYFLADKEFTITPNGYALDQPGYNIHAVRTFTTFEPSHMEFIPVDEKVLEQLRGAKIVRLGNRIAIDLDNDGVDENIRLDLHGRLWSDDEHDAMAYGEYTLRVANDTIEGFGENTHCNVYGTALEDGHILLILFQEGPSDDSVCDFYRYDRGYLEKIGEIYDDVKSIEVYDGTFFGTERCDVMDTAQIDKSWVLNEDGYLVEEEQDIYHMWHYVQPKDESWYAYLKYSIRAYEDMDYNSTAIQLSPQLVYFPYTDGKEWVYVEGKENSGWINAGLWSSNDKRDTFDGLLFAD